MSSGPVSDPGEIVCSLQMAPPWDGGWCPFLIIGSDHRPAQIAQLRRDFVLILTAGHPSSFPRRRRPRNRSRNQGPTSVLAVVVQRVASVGCASPGLAPEEVAETVAPVESAGEMAEVSPHAPSLPNTHEFRFASHIRVVFLAMYKIRGEEAHAELVIDRGDLLHAFSQVGVDDGRRIAEALRRCGPVKRGPGLRIVQEITHPGMDAAHVQSLGCGRPAAGPIAIGPVVGYVLPDELRGRTP